MFFVKITSDVRKKVMKLLSKKLIRDTFFQSFNK